MKKTNLSLMILIFIMTSMIVSCVREPLSEPAFSTITDNSDLYADTDLDDGIMSGWIRIKLDDNSNPIAAGIYTRGELSTGNPQLDEIIAQLGVTEVRRTFTDGGKFAQRRRKYGFHLWYDLKIDDQIAVTRAQSKLADIPGVAIAEPIAKIKPAEYKVMPETAVYVPAANRIPMNGDLPFNDPQLHLQWHYNNDGSLPKSIAGSDINLFEGWKITAGDPDVIVAVIDLGVDFDHPDLHDNMWYNEAEMNGDPNVDDDGNGFVDDIYGVNLCSNSSKNHYNNQSGEVCCGDHGTHVAGTIAAVNNNGIGVCGVAGGSGNNDGVKIMTIQIMNPDGQAGKNSYSDIENAFLYAAENGAVIVNCSLTVASSYFPATMQAMEDAMKYFVETAGNDENGNQIGPVDGGVILCATGNFFKSSINYPALSPYTIAVAATGSYYGIAAYSDRGVGTDIFAPGGDYYDDSNNQILSTLPTDLGEYGYMIGTSMACPHVSGVAALIASYHKGKGFTAQNLKDILLRSVRPLPGIENLDLGANKGIGIVDASLIDIHDPQQAPEHIDNFTATPAPAAIQFEWPVVTDANGMPVSYYSLQITETDTNTSSALTINNTYSPDETVSFTFNAKSEATYNCMLTAVDRFGYTTSSDNIEVTTLIFENHAPVLVSKFYDINFRNIGEDNYNTINVSLYFREDDKQYGDYLTFSMLSSNPEIVRADKFNESLFHIVPLAEGSATITVIATDSRGATTETSFNATVKEEDILLPELIASFGSISMKVGETKSFQLDQYFHIPDDARGKITFSANSQNPQLADATIINNKLLSVNAKGNGSVQITVEATIQNGGSVSDILTVEIFDESATSNIVVSPNPVQDIVSLSIKSLAGKTVKVHILDNGMRTVFNSDVQLDTAGVAKLNVANLKPGVYNIRVNADGKTIANTFVKQ